MIDNWISNREYCMHFKWKEKLKKLFKTAQTHPSLSSRQFPLAESEMNSTSVCSQIFDDAKHTHRRIHMLSAMLSFLYFKYMIEKKWILIRAVWELNKYISVRIRLIMLIFTWLLGECNSLLFLTRRLREIETLEMTKKKFHKTKCFQLVTVNVLHQSHHYIINNSFGCERSL